MKAFVLIHDVAADSSHPFRASVPDNRFDTAMLVAVLVALVGFACMRRIQQRRAAQRRAQRKARGTLLTALRIDSILNFRAAKAAKELALTPKERAMQKYAHTPRSTMYHLNRFSVGDRVLYICGAEGTVVGVDGDGDLHVFSEIYGTHVWYVKRCRRSMSKGDRVTFLGCCEGTIVDFDKDDNLLVTKHCGGTDVWCRSLTTRLISVGDRVHYPGDVKGTVEGFDEDGDCKVMTDTLGYMVLYLSKCQQGIGDLDGDAFPTWKEKSQKILEELRRQWQQGVEDNDNPAI